MLATAADVMRAAASDTATRDELAEAGARGRAAGAVWARTGERPPCPYPLGTLRQHVWLRWAVRARLVGVGLLQQAPVTMAGRLPSHG